MANWVGVGFPAISVGCPVGLVGVQPLSLCRFTHGGTGNKPGLGQGKQDAGEPCFFSSVCLEPSVLDLRWGWCVDWGGKPWDKL